MHPGLRTVFAALAAVVVGTARAAMSNEDCLGCHSDPSLTTEKGRSAFVNEAGLAGGPHARLACTDCHRQPADYESVPHFSVYEAVNCAVCHQSAAQSFRAGFHGRALARGDSEAPNCCACHGVCDDPHNLQSLNLQLAEQACRKCHPGQTRAYDRSVHGVTGNPKRPGCVTCHPTHSAALPPSVGAVNRLCERCHSGAMAQVQEGGHFLAEGAAAVMSCASCHDVHGTHKPHLDATTLKACAECHPGYREQFAGSVHESLLASGRMNCLSCHRTHQVTDAAEQEDFGCGQCHTQVEEQYRASAHRLARLHGNRVAATCADCHSGHHVRHPSHPDSPVHHRNVPNTCGKCHTDQAVITSDYVRLPISLPSYTASIHGQGWRVGKGTAVCTDCHGVHLLQAASVPTSTIHKQNLAATCGKCHREQAEQYSRSVHGRAVAHGIADSPSCTDCHDEHLIYRVTDPRAAVRPERQASETCGRCHEDAQMAARYGLPQKVVESYQDSYHGWAIKRGGKAVAVCVDCHNTHDIGSRLDPTSSIHPDNVVRTCGRCHANSNAQFAASYTHILARGRLMVHDYVRIIYIVLIAAVLGGMALHNLVIYLHELRAHYRRVHSEPTVVRMTPAEVAQHMVLLVSFTGLAVTGFALRFPEAWWVRILTGWGLSEEARRVIHRGLATVLVAASLYHLYYVVFTVRGRALLRAMAPAAADLADAVRNVWAHLRRDVAPPQFGVFDYTQKAEYWALIWGTAVMTITGFVLWFPTLATSWLPAWVVRVCEVIHFYEAILAVSAIVIWHFFYVIFIPREYPMSWIWISGKMSLEQWRHHHGRAAGKEAEVAGGEREVAGK